MIYFQQKVAELKRVESTVFTICLSLSDDEQAASAVAEQALIALFTDDRYWKLDNEKRQVHILKLIARMIAERAHSQNKPISSVV